MDLNTILIILGILALVALVAHGLWANRREKSRYFENANTFSRDNRVHNKDEPNAEQVAMPEFVQANQPQQSPEHNVNPHNGENAFSDFTTPQSSVNEPPSLDEIKITLANQVTPPTTQYDLGYQTQPLQTETPITEMQVKDIHSLSSDDYTRLQMENSLRVQLQDTPKVEPAVEITAQQSFVSSAPLQQPIAEGNPQLQAQPTQRTSNPSRYIILYVVAAENRQFQGLKLAQALEDAGFMFGKNDRYHYHLHLNMASPVLFTVANISPPGTFDHYAMTEFSTAGIAIYMQLPSMGNDKANLKTMIRTARNLANQLGGFVLTDQQELFTEMSEQEYFAKLI